MPHLFDLRGESREKANKVNTLYINIHAKFLQFQNMDPEIQIKDDVL